MSNNRFDTSMARRFGLTRPIVAWGPRDCTGCEHNNGVPGRDKYGDHDEGTCSKNQGHRTSAHDAVRDLLIAFLRQCHFQDIRWEVKNWDHTAGPNVKEGQRRVPDIICTDPYSKTVYIIDVRIAWNLSTSGGGDGEYYTGKLAKEAEDVKNSTGSGWGHCLKHHQDFKDGAKFIPFGVEISGELGPAAQQFFDGAQRWIRATHDTSLYHWTAPSFRRFWTQRLGVSLVNSRAKVGMAAARRDWANTFARTGIASMAPPL